MSGQIMKKTIEVMIAMRLKAHQKNLHRCTSWSRTGQTATELINVTSIDCLLDLVAGDTSSDKNTYRSVRFLSCPNSVGMVPVSWLWARSLDE
jgi:hypothetical protein